MGIRKILAGVGCSFLALGSASGAFAQVEQDVSSAQVRRVVEELSGIVNSGIAGLPGVITDRFSDGPQIDSVSQYLLAKYAEMGIAAQALPYDPMAVLPEYEAQTRQTYSGYLARFERPYTTDFADLCQNRLDEARREAIERRLARVRIPIEEICARSEEQRFSFYVDRVVRHSVSLTERFLRGRARATWPNVVAQISTASGEAGGPLLRPLCVLGAHMDSIARDGGGRGPVISPGTLAPGADDNASGTAALLLLARRLKPWIEEHQTQISCDVLLVHFSGEEEGLFGSLAFLASQHQGRPIRWMVNFDMIGFNSAPSGREKMNIGFEAERSAELARDFSHETSSLPVLLVEKSQFVYSSDQLTFWNAGIPAVCVSEQACSTERCQTPYEFFNPHLHTPEDTTSHMDFEYAAGIVRASEQGLRRALTRGIRIQEPSLPGAPLGRSDSR